MSNINWFMQTAQHSIKEFLAPTRCVVCGCFGRDFCRDCLTILIPLKSQCPVCRLPSANYDTHELCKSQTSLDYLIVSCTYNDIAKCLVEELKYKFNRDISKELMQIMISNEDICEILSEQAVFVPVPLHSKREKWRGFNQAEVLVDEMIKMSQKTNQFTTYYDYIEQNTIKYDGIITKSKLLKRVRNNKPQAWLEREQRLKNLDGSFMIDKDEYQKLYKDRKTLSIVLVDDVTTTGTTLNECAKILKDAGFKYVGAVVFARGE